MCHERLAVVLLLAFVVSAAVLVPPPATVFRMTVASAAQDPSAVEAALGLDRPTRWLIQQGLRKEGFDASEPDGLFGPQTREAIRRWQEARGMPTTGYLDGLQAELLRVAGEPRPAESEVAATDVPPVAESPAAPPAATESPAPVQAVSCEDWNTQEFFEMATAEDVTGCLEAGADVAARDEDEITPLHWATYTSYDPAVVDALLAAGADLEARNGNGSTPLHNAAYTTRIRPCSSFC